MKQQVYINSELSKHRALALLESLDFKKPTFMVLNDKTKRTERQNAYLWGVVYPMIRDHIFESQGTHFSTDAIHEWFKTEFLSGEVVSINGKQMIFRSTKDLDRKEFFEAYIDKITYYAAENLGLVIPDPRGHV